MPVFNEGNFIRRSLGALVNQSYSHDRMEIIVAEGLSTDNTRALIIEIASESSVPVIVVDNPKQIAPSGLNRALAIAKGDIIVRTDGHTIVEADYVSECVEALKRTDAGNVGGKMNAVSEGSIGNSITLATSSKFGIGNARFHYSDREEYVDTVYLGAWPRRIFEQYGLFNEELVRNQDDEFNYRIRANGEKILLSPKIKSKYFSRSTFKSLWRQYFQYGYWKVRVLQMHPKQMSLRQFVPAALVLSLILTSILSLLGPLGTWAFLAVLSSYVISNIAASFLTAKTHFALIPLISLGFAILHFSYGFGFLLGVFSFAGHWFRTKSSDPLPVDH
ncbi:MAG: glycosyltransferase family 2 protein [Pyrinomonadaceae bacterium]